MYDTVVRKVKPALVATSIKQACIQFLQKANTSLKITCIKQAPVLSKPILNPLAPCLLQVRLYNHTATKGNIMSVKL